MYSKQLYEVWNHIILRLPAKNTIVIATIATAVDQVKTDEGTPKLDKSKNNITAKIFQTFS